MMKQRLKTCRTCGKLFIENLIRTNMRFQMMKSRLKTCRTCGKLFISTGTLSKHKISHNEEKAQNLQDMWEIIHGDWNLEQTQDFT